MPATNDYTDAVGLLHFVLLALAGFRIAFAIAGTRGGARTGQDGVLHSLTGTVAGCSTWVSTAVVTAHWFIVDPAGMYRAEHGTGWPVVVWWLFVLSMAASAVVVLIARVDTIRTSQVAPPEAPVPAPPPATR